MKRKRDSDKKERPGGMLRQRYGLQAVFRYIPAECGCVPPGVKDFEIVPVLAL
jgi:hypothetical protein